MPDQAARATDPHPVVAALVEQVRDYAIIGLDVHGVIVSWNAGAQSVKGYSAEEILGTHFSVFYPAADRRAGLPADLLEQARREGRVEHTGWRVRRDGTQFWGDVVITALRDPAGTLIGYGKVTRDLTEQHRLEADLRRSEQRFRLLVSQVVDYAILALDPHGIIETWNAGAEQVKGYEAHEIIGKHFSVFYTEEDRYDGLPLRLLDEARTLGRVEHTGWRVRKDGSRFWADVIITALRDEQGGLTGYAKVTRDLTEQHDLEDALRASEERFRVLVSQVLDYAIIALDAQGVVQTWNAGAEQVKGYAEEEILGKHFSVFYTEKDKAAGLPLRLLDEARALGRAEHTGWRVRKDGSRFWGGVVLTALHDDSGRLTGFGKVTRDLTEQHALDAARESFFRGISHDLKTPLAALKGFADILASAPTEQQQRQVTARLRANVDRLTQMVDELAEHARLRAGAFPLRLERVDLVGLLRQVARDLDPLLHTHDVVVSGESVELDADRSLLERMVVNLLSNSAKYSPAGSRIRADVTSDAQRVRLVITDQGRGINESDLPVIFEEFQRGGLAEVDGGTGLGLSSVKRVVDLHHGHVWLESEVGSGTEVTVVLPRSQPE